MTKPIIVKVQRALFPPGAPALVYDEGRRHFMEIPWDALPPSVRDSFREGRPKVFWRVEIEGARPNTSVTFVAKTEDQPW